MVYVDAVHFAPHLAVDVQELDCDFCVCSTFKFFGPHCGMLFGKASLMRALRPYKLSVSADTLPGPTQFQRWETGTLNFEGLAGIRAVMDYFASIADRFGNYIILQFLLLYNDIFQLKNRKFSRKNLTIM